MIKYLIIDTETTGLNIVKDKAFLFQYGLVDEKLNLTKSVALYENEYVELHMFLQHLKTVPTIVGHNIKFDIHMCLNAGVPLSDLEDKNFIDTQVLARLCINNDLQSEKSFSTSLKKLAVRYLGINSNNEERVLKTELSMLTSKHKDDMKDWFIICGLWDENISNTLSTKRMNEIYNKWNKIYHKYPELEEAREDFLEKHPAPNYSDCTNVKQYGLTDIVLTHGLFKLWYPDIIRLKQVPTLLRISKAIIPLVVMERKGIVIDVSKILDDRDALIKEMSQIEIIDPRTNKKLNIGQHAKLKELYEYESGIELDSADKEARASVMKLSLAARQATYLANMSKYMNTYITGMLNKMVKVDNEYRVYTQYHIAGTVTGRLSSDFQQFPNDPLVLNNGYEVNIRSWFVVPKENKYMFYFDYSQLELRLQCEWTNIVNGYPDINMARAFGPYKCIETNGKYYLEEDQTVEWRPNDLHAMTAKLAFPDIDENHPDWKHYRSLGKRTNFAVNYGASAPRVQQALKVTFAEAQALVKGYKETFKGVVDFTKWIKNRVYVTTNIPNLMLRRYYSRNSHLLLNWLVQGSGADLLLLKLDEVYQYIKDKPHWNYMITIHDEIGFTCDDIPEAQLNTEVKEIQKLLGHKFTAVDIICDVECTTTKWSEKSDWKENNHDSI